MTDPHVLPAHLPAPVDDGGAAHLTAQPWPALALPATDGTQVRVSGLPGRSVVYGYPMTARPDHPLPDGWDVMPGARGCTPQACAFRDHHTQLAALGARVFGLSTQSTAYQQEAAGRLHLPYPLLSDAALGLTGALRLPTFDVPGVPAGERPTLLRRITLIVRDGVIEQVFYPVFPPDRSAEQVLGWLERQT